MACTTREAMVEDIAKRAIAQLKEDNKKLDKPLTGPAIKAKAYEVAEAIVAKSQVLAEGPVTPESTAAIKANATTAIQPSEADRPIIPIPEQLRAKHEAYQKNPNNETAQAIINAETAYGFRNNKGELLVKFKRPKVLGSSDNISIDEGMTDEQFTEYYENTDGSMSKAD